MKFRPSPPLKLLRRLVRSIEANGVRGAIVHSIQRLFRSLRNHGLHGTLNRAFIKAPVAPGVDAPEPPHPFDLQYGTDTGGYTSSADLHGKTLSSLYTTAYVGIAPSALSSALSSLKINFGEFTFVDVGCGKGRAILVAAQFPFRHLFGVEIAPELCVTARANLTLRPELANRASIINEDAVSVTYPEGPLFIFMFHPFLAPVLRRVLANLEAQLRNSPRTTYLLYARNPRYTHVLEKFPFLQELSETAHPLSSEDTAVDLFRLTHEPFTLYSANLTI
jgi:SAM-dependent methyltransferase